jgi:hypothetical protein
MIFFFKAEESAFLNVLYLLKEDTQMSLEAIAFVMLAMPIS